MEASVVLKIGRGQEVRDYNVTKPIVSIGRAAESDIVLADPLVSRNHARIEWNGATLSVADLGSSNGTNANGRQLDPRVPKILKNGDVISIGDFNITVVISQAEGPTVVGQKVAETLAKPQMAAETFVRAGADETVTRQTAAPPPPRLAIVTPRLSMEVPLKGTSMIVGRDPGCDIVIDDPMVSRRHAQINAVAGGWEIVDMGSANGLVSQGRRIAKKPLRPGETLFIGPSIKLTYKVAELAPDAMTAGYAPVAGTADTINVRPPVVARPPMAPPSFPQPPQVQVVFSSPGVGVEPLRKPQSRKHTIPQTGVLTIGRTSENDIVIDSVSVSRHHARIVRDAAGSLLLEDLGSTNGTYLNGHRITRPNPLSDGDVIRIGAVKFSYARGLLDQIDEGGYVRLDALHLNKHVGEGLNLLKDISFSIEPHEFVAVVGVSGAGKSTLLDALNGFRPATGGAVMVNGSNLYENFDSFRAQIGYVPQEDIIHRELTVREALDYAARLRLPADVTPEMRAKRVDEVIAALNLVERKNLQVRRLSGGQRKRVSMGVELLTQPGLFFLDEATSGLDPGTEGDMMRLLRKLSDEGQTILLITHATKNVMLCDQVAFLAKGGYLAYFGPPEEALGFFGVKEFDEIYSKLERESTPEKWGQRYQQSPQFQKYVVARLSEQYGDGFKAQSQVIATAPAPGAAVKKV